MARLTNPCLVMPMRERGTEGVARRSRVEVIDEKLELGPEEQRLVEEILAKLSDRGEKAQELSKLFGKLDRVLLRLAKQSVQRRRG